MKITRSVTIPDYVYLFYEKVAQELQLPKPEDRMSDVLIRCAGTLSQGILEKRNPL